MDENIGRVDKKSIIRALQEAMGGSTRPRLRPKGIGSRIPPVGRGMGEMMGRIPPVGKGVGGDMDLSPEEEKALQMLLQMRRMKNQDAERKAFPPASMMNGGGVAVAKKRKKPKKGCVMKGRGGSYKGMK